MSTPEKLLGLLVKKVKAFKVGRKIEPNAILMSLEQLHLVSEIDRDEFKKKLPTVDLLIPVPECAALQEFDLPLPALLPVVVMKTQSERTEKLLGKDL